MSKMIYRKKSWAKERSVIGRPDGTYDGFYGKTCVKLAGTYEDAERAVQEALEADVESHKNDGRTWR